MKFYILFIAFFYSGFIFGQFSDDFSDGNFDNPSWLGNIDHFVQNDGQQLQLNAPGAGQSLIYLPISVTDSVVWKFWHKMDFSPSNANHSQIYLAASTTDLLTANGIFLQLGQNGSDDAIQVIQRIEGNEEIVATSELGSISTNPVELSIVIQKLGDNWSLSVDFSGGQNEVPTASWIKTLDAGAYYFGLHCQYTASRVDQFYFDDISFQPWVPDLTPPVLLFAQANNSQQVTLHFDEPIGVTSLDISHFSLSGNVDIADIDFIESDSSQIVLFLSQDLENGATYTASAQDISDRAGNLGDGSADFTYLVPEVIAPFDILINEILADPSPSVGLPEKEFVELYNRSDKILELSELTLSVNSTSKSLPSFSLLPQKMVILVDIADTALWQGFGAVIGMDLPGLSNSGATLTLSSGTEIIHQIDYNNHSYRNKDKDDGGWSLEIINPENPCLGEENWMASNSLQGGTPGQINSVLDTDFFNKPIEIIRAYPYSATKVAIEFDQLVGDDAENISKYHFDPNVNILSTTRSENQVILKLATPLAVGTIYELTIFDKITNCIHQLPNLQTTIKLGLAEAPTRGDVIINEVLFNPVTGGSDYVEILNISDKIVDIGSFTLANMQKTGAIRTISTSALLFPNQYVAFTPNRFQVASQYDVPDTAWIIENALPPLDDERGNVSLIYGGTIIDSIQYTENMHVAFVYDEEGVALERINPFGNSLTTSNWISAAQNVNYGTPGYKNSQYLSTGSGGRDYVQVNQKIFSPNGDGFEDFVLFEYELPTSGYTLNARVFNVNGQFVTRLSNNELVGSHGSLRWDGNDEFGGLLPAGVYVVRFEFYEPDGGKLVELETCGIVWE